MDNSESETLRELRELRAEVQRLKRTILFLVIGIGIVVVWMVPDSFFPVIIVGTVLGYLFDRNGFPIFSWRSDGNKNDA
jgi:hypothetical protein